MSRSPRVDSLLVDFLPRAIDRFRADFPAVNYTVSAVSARPTSRMLVADGDADIGFTFVSRSAGLGSLHGRDPRTHRGGDAGRPSACFAADRRARRRAAPIRFFTQPGAPAPGNRGGPRLRRLQDVSRRARFSNSIQMLKLCVMLNMGIAFFTRLGFLHEIEAGDLVWRPFSLAGRSTSLRIGLLVPATRAMSPPAQQLARHLADDLNRLGSI